MIVGYLCNCGNSYSPPKRTSGYCDACRIAVTAADNKAITDRGAELKAFKQQQATELEAFKQRQTIELLAFEQRTKLRRKNAVIIALQIRGHLCE